MILTGHCIEVLATLPEQSVQAAITSPPYWGLRDYGTEAVVWDDGWEGEIGQEPTPELFVQHLVQVFRAVRRVLRDDGTLWVNLGDTYNTAGGADHRNGKSLGGQPRGGSQITMSVRARKALKNAGVPSKSLIGIPWRFAIAMMSDGWILRQDIIWHKPNPMPESVTDRCTKAHEYVFLFAREPRYFWDPSAMQEPAAWERWVKQTIVKPLPGAGSWMVAKPIAELPVRDRKNRRSVWTVSNGGVPQAHFATFPPDLIRPMILASTRIGDTVLDPFSGAGTTVLVAEEQGRIGIGIEINPAYVAIAKRRIPLRLDLTADAGETVRVGSAQP